MKKIMKETYQHLILSILTAGFVLLPGAVTAEDVRTEPVTVTATRSEVSLQDAPGAITIITVDDIRDMPAGDLLEAIRETPGISMIGRSVGGRKNISIRGMEARHTLVLIDGKRIAAPGSNFGHANYKNNWLNSENIERIEIVRGPLSALYGSEAFGGVINIITKPISRKKWSLGANIGGGVTDDDGGDNAYISAYASGQVIQDRLGIYISVGYDKDDDTPLEDNPKITELEGIETLSLSSKVAFTPNKNHTLELGVDLSEGERWLDFSSWGILTDAEFEINTSMLSLSWKGTLGPTSSIIQAYRTAIENNYIKTISGRTTDYLEEYANDVVDAQTSFALGRNLFTVGGEFRKEDIEGPSLLSGSADAVHSALFIQDEIEFFDKLRITLGGRMDHHDEFGSEFSPRIYGLFQVTDNTHLKAGYGHAFNAPTVKQVSKEYVFDGPHSFRGNPDIGPETSDNYELGVEYMGSPFWAKAFYFYNDIEDMIQWAVFGPPDFSAGQPRFTFRAENIGQAKTQGVETGMGVALDSGLELSINYTYLDAEDTKNDERLASKPKHTVNAKLGYTLNQYGLSAALRFQFIGDQVLDGSGFPAGLEDVPDYSLWHFSVRKKLLNKLELQVGVENIGDVRLADKSDLFRHEERGRFFYAALRAAF